jgi:hypothetical protein
MSSIFYFVLSLLSSSKEALETLEIKPEEDQKFTLCYIPDGKEEKACETIDFQNEEFFKQFMEMGFFDKLFKNDTSASGSHTSSTRSCEEEGRESARTVCRQNDHACKERVHDKTTERCYQERQKTGENTAGSPSHSEGKVEKKDKK